MVGIGGSVFGYLVRSLDEFAGYCMAASAFLALAHTFSEGGHIRVTVLVQRLHGTARRRLEIACHLAAACLAAFFAWYSVKLVVVSWQIGELSQGLVPLPLWIPQLAMGIGTTVFAIAVVERLVAVWLGEAVDDGDGGGHGADR